MRNIISNSCNAVTQRVSSEDLVPNIAHLVWLGGGPMDFLFYLCVLSLVYVAEVDTVYIHGDAPPTGRYWNMVKDFPQIKLIYREKFIFKTHFINLIYSYYSKISNEFTFYFILKY